MRNKNEVNKMAEYKFKSNAIEVDFGVQQGWQCPVCKRVYSPTTIMCICCGNTEPVTSTGDTSLMGDYNLQQERK